MSKKRGVGIAALIIAGIAVLGLAAAVYAKYFAEFQASGGAKVAKWAFESDNQNSSVTCSLTSTVASGAVKAGTGGVDIIAPGTSGTCSIQLLNTNSEVMVKYTITADAATSGVPTNLKLNGSSLNSFTKSGTIVIGGSTTENITWEWPYETGTVTDGVAAGDTDDTNDGKAGGNMTLVFNVVGVQVNPTTGQ